MTTPGHVCSSGISIGFELFELQVIGNHCVTAREISI